MSQSTSRVGKRGTVVIPAALRRRFGIEEGSLVIAEDREEGILIRPAVAAPLLTVDFRRFGPYYRKSVGSVVRHRDC